MFSGAAGDPSAVKLRLATPAAGMSSVQLISAILETSADPHRLLSYVFARIPC